MVLDVSRLGSAPALRAALVAAVSVLHEAKESRGPALDAVRTELAKLARGDDLARIADVVPPVVTFAGDVAAAGELHHARSILVAVLQIVLGDPYGVLLSTDPRSMRDKARDVAARAPAVDALASVAGVLVQLAGDPAADAPAEGSQRRGCSTGLEEVTRTARFSCTLLPRDLVPAPLREHVDAKERAWTRAWAFLWERETDPELATLAMRDDAAPPLVRAAAALGLGAHDVAQGKQPRAEIWQVLASLVPTFHDSWGDAWAPSGLFADLHDSLEFALLGTESRLRFGATQPDRIVHLSHVLLAGLDAFPDVRRHRAAWAAGLLWFVFGARGEPWGQTRDEPLIPPSEELSSLEREVLETVATKVSSLQWNYDVHHALCRVCIPATWHGLRRWLALDPPGPSWSPVTVSDAGRSRVLPLALAAQRLLAGRVETSDLAGAMARALTAVELTDLVFHGLDWFDARLHCTASTLTTEELLQSLQELVTIAVTQADAEPMIQELSLRLERILRADYSYRDTALAMQALARHLRGRGHVLPSRYDVMIVDIVTAYPGSPGAAREILESLPNGRRDAIIVRSLEMPAFRGRHDFGDLLSEEMRRDPMVMRPPKELPESMRQLADALDGAFHEVMDDED